MAIATKEKGMKIIEKEITVEELSRRIQNVDPHKLITVHIEELRKDIKDKTNKKSNWAKFAERVHKESPLSGAGDYVLASSKELREDFHFKHDNE